MSTLTTARTPARTHHALRLLLATLVVATAATLSQTAWAMPGGHGGHSGMGMMADGRHMERLLDAVNATPDQRSQIKALADAARADLRAQREAGRKLHEQGQSLWAQPTVDARAAEALRQQMLAQHDQASKRKMQLMLDVSRVLTPEQRKTLADRMQQRRSMMERHRGERESLERAAPRQ
jgi:periplasmic protein CpxP/Spy